MRNADTTSVRIHIRLYSSGVCRETKNRNVITPPSDQKRVLIKIPPRVDEQVVKENVYLGEKSQVS